MIGSAKPSGFARLRRFAAPGRSARLWPAPFTGTHPSGSTGPAGPKFFQLGHRAAAIKTQRLVCRRGRAGFGPSTHDLRLGPEGQ